MNNNLKRAVALRKMIQDIVGINHSSILYLVYILLSATAPFICKNSTFKILRAARTVSERKQNIDGSKRIKHRKQV